MKANQMIKRRRTTLLRVFLTFLTWTGVGVGLTSCTDDSDEPRISGVEASVDAPVLSSWKTRTAATCWPMPTG